MNINRGFFNSIPSHITNFLGSSNFSRVESLLSRISTHNMLRINPIVLGAILFITLFDTNHAVEVSKEKQKVCVIGAGASGLATTKLLAEKSDKFDIITFEQKSDVGGLWIYSDNTDVDENGLPVQSAVYKYLRTNFPASLMTYPDYPENVVGDSTCQPHEKVLQYLRNYTDHFNLRKYIQPNTLVKKVTPIVENGDRRNTQWKIETKNLNTKVEQVFLCDSVIVCNGHNTKPRIPIIPGIENFTGKVIHSHIYRVPEVFAGKKVVALGAGPSGAEIGVAISEYAEKVYLSHNRDKLRAKFPTNMVQVSGVVGANGDKLILKDGSEIEADVLMYCTGYEIDFPFFDQNSGIIVEDNYVQFVYKQIVNVKYPSMGFIGLTWVNEPYSIWYSQAKYYIALLEGKAKLPSESEILKDTDLKGKLKRHAHKLNVTEQFEYEDELAKLSGVKPLPSYYKKGTYLWTPHAWANIADFRDDIFRIHENGDIEIITKK